MADLDDSDKDGAERDASAQKAYADAAQAVPVAARPPKPKSEPAKGTAKAFATKPPATSKAKVRAKPVAAKAPPKGSAARKLPAKAKSAPGPKAKPRPITSTTDNTENELFAGLLNFPIVKEPMMDMSANFAGFQEAITEAQAKAKSAFQKGSSMLGEVGDFTKGNVEAMIESGKILAGGVQEMGSTFVSEGRTAFETMSSDVKELAGAKSPTDFFKLQGDMMKKNLDSAVAYGSKNSEAMLKLMSDVMAPLSGRMSMAMEKVRETTV